VCFARDQRAHNTHAAITDREDVDPAGHRAAGRPDAPGQRGSVCPSVGVPVLFEYEAWHEAIKKLLSLVIQRLPSYVFSFWVDEPDVFGISSLDSCPLAFRVPL